MHYRDVDLCSMLLDTLDDRTWPVWLVIGCLGLIAAWDGVEWVLRRIK